MTHARHVLLNGDWSETCPAEDRGLMYGDGVFRTLRLAAGRPVWWPDHAAKLRADCGRLDIAAPTEAEWLADLGKLAVVQPDAVIKLMVTRGVGARGYRPPASARVTRMAIVYPSVQHAEKLAEDGIMVRLCELRLAAQPRLAGIKHLNRLENVLARMEWDDGAIAEGLLLDQDGRAVCGTSSNLFILRGNALLTPRLERCGVAGVARTRLLRAAGRLGLSAEEADLTLHDVMAADALFFCNSLIGLRWVTRLADRHWSRPAQHAPLSECLND